MGETYRWVKLLPLPAGDIYGRNSLRQDALASMIIAPNSSPG